MSPPRWGSVYIYFMWKYVYSCLVLNLFLLCIYALTFCRKDLTCCLVFVGRTCFSQSTLFLLPAIIPPVAQSKNVGVLPDSSLSPSSWFSPSSNPVSSLFTTSLVSSLPTISPLPPPQTTGGFPGGSAGKESACKAGDPGLSPGLGRSPGEGNGYPFSILAWRIPWTYDHKWTGL